MRSKNSFVIIFTLILIAVFSLSSFEAFAAPSSRNKPSQQFKIEDDEDWLDDEDEDEDENWDEEEDEDDLPSKPEAPQAEVDYWQSRGLTPERSSTNANKVIRSYKLDKDVERMLLEKHKYAGNSGIGKRAQMERYEDILRYFDHDYFAAYMIAQLNFEMQRYSTADKWINKALELYPYYYPAKRLAPKIKGALEKNR